MCALWLCGSACALSANRLSAVMRSWREWTERAGGGVLRLCAHHSPACAWPHGGSVCLGVGFLVFCVPVRVLLVVGALLRARAWGGRCCACVCVCGVADR